MRITVNKKACYATGKTMHIICVGGNAIWRSIRFKI